ncbi:flotillin-1-like, partial [Corapipo altera]|uniref:flotillin-1-like n=1 Tax=Corapipo altera TaxID=415028 RepID=UPI000FD63B5C
MGCTWIHLGDVGYTWIHLGDMGYTWGTPGISLGISVVSYTLEDVHDEQDYLHSLGKARTAQVQRDARVGEAEAKRDAGIR